MTAAGFVDVEVDRVRRRCRVHREGRAWTVQAAGTIARFTEVSADETDRRASQAGDAFSPLPGTVTSVAVAPGDTVSAGDLLVVVEAMKMEHQIRAPGYGVVEKVQVTAGSTVAARELLVALRAEDPPRPVSEPSNEQRRRVNQ